MVGRRGGDGARETFRIAEKLEKLRILGGEGAREEKAICPGDLWDMGNEEGLEVVQTGSRRLWKNPERGQQRAGLSSSMPLRGGLLGKALDGGGGGRGGLLN